VVNGNVIVVVANNNGGQIFSFDASGNPGPTVTSGVQHPQGLTLTNKAYQKLSDCFQDPNTPCNVLGNDGHGNKLINHLVSGGGANVDGNIAEDMCAVEMDPRIAACNSCTNAANSICANLPANQQGKYKNGLSVAEACGAGFDNPLHPLVIPNSLCGASGPTHGGFTVVRTRTSIDSGPNGFRLNGKFAVSDSDFTGLPADAMDPTCQAAPFQAAGWGAYPEDGLNPGGNFVLDLTNACHTPVAGHGPLSAFFMGLSANFGVYPHGVVDYVTADYTTLLSTITAQTQSLAVPPATFVLTPPSSGNFTYELQQCIKEGERAFLNGSSFYLRAAQTLLIGDYMVFSNAHAESSPPFTKPFAPDNDWVNPSGTDRGLIEATRFSILVRAMTPPGDTSLVHLTLGSPPSTTTPDIRPIINGTPSPTGANGQLYTYGPATTDFADNSNTPMVYSFTGPSWATLSITNNQALVSGKAKKNGSPFTFVLTATDPCGATQSQTWTVTVN
jgi:hypothetical protein